MPSATHPQAKFDPIPTNLNLEELVENTPNFQWVQRVPASRISRLGAQAFERLVLLHVIQGGKPLIIEQWNDRLPRKLFGREWLEETYNKKEEVVRDIGSQADIRMTIGHYLRSMKQLTDQWTPANFRDERRQRLYLKDIDCPPEWHDWLQKVLPPNVFYLNENVDERGGQSNREDDMFVERSTAPAGDLMSCLPEPMRAQNLMCYIGHEGTYTPAHREMCASLGQNIMVDASGDGNGEKPGSSIWFMTETKDREVVKEYFLSMLGHDIEIERHFAQINAWKKATFPVYVVEQKLGDFVLVPPLAPHQVWNRGTRTMKVAWNRTTVETLEMALHEALPKARLVCRDEQYKNKTIIYYALQKYCRDLQNMEDSADMGFLGIGQNLARNSERSKQMIQDFRRLFNLFTEIMVDEMFGTKEKDVEYIEFDSNITCSYCRANIFNRFLTCKHCVRTLPDDDEDTYDVCMECYAMGRSCVCTSGLNWCEQWHWNELVDNYERWRTMIIIEDGFVDINNSPLPLELARKKMGKKSVAQICQEQLRRRPFKDITEVDEPEVLEPSDQEVDDEGRPVKKKRSRKKKKGELYRCHVCCHKDNTYRLAFCSNHGCTEAYCYGTLFRAFDLMPQDVMQMEKWQCPKCLKICNCGSCRRCNVGTPYTPRSTLLGHDTRRIADDRSIELLVDLRVHNLTWLKATGDESRNKDSRRMQKLKEQANAEKAKSSQDKDIVGLGTLNQPAANGYDDQSNILGAHEAGELASTADNANGNATGDMPLSSIGAARLDSNDPRGVPADHLDAPGEPEDLSMLQGADQPVNLPYSTYPDPAALSTRQLGLAYYQQDDSPDKILFDEYETPPADFEDFEEEQSEFVKKSLRAAKRKARQENDDDPDFLGPRSQKKKAKSIAQDPAAYSAMVDPALLEEETTASDATNGNSSEGPAIAGSAIRPKVDEVVAEGGGAVERPQQSPELYEPNRPALRHAKPMVSYVEPEDAAEEVNEVLPPNEPIMAFGDDALGQQKGAGDPLYLAADAIRAITRQTAEPGLSPQANNTHVPAAAAANPLRRRGPGRPRGSATRHASLRSTAVDPKPPEPRPRQSRTSLLASQGLDRSDMRHPVDDSDSEQENTNDINAQPAAELGEAERRETEGHKHGGQAGGSQSDGEHGQPSAQPGPRRRGRPPKQEGPATSAGSKRLSQPTPSSTKPPEQKFLSMAERMALKGKKFKIGARKSTTASAPSATPQSGQRAVTTVELDMTPREPPSENRRTQKPVETQNERAITNKENDSGHGASVKDTTSARGPTPATSTPSGPRVQVPQPAPRPSSAASRPVAAPAPAPPKPAPTVVKLGDDYDEDDDDSYELIDDTSDNDADGASSGSEPEGDDSDDEVIPARKPSYATRGQPAAIRRGAMRGGMARGRGWVRGRGRPRGRPRWS